jgi:hypothetical protein
VENPASKFRIQSFSDLIFGLALSITALALIGRSVRTFSDVTDGILLFSFGFLILISVWFRYSQVMTVVRRETSVLLSLNVLMLVFVSLEPYLLNLLLFPAPAGVGDMDWWLYVSSLYAIDWGSLILLLGALDALALRGLDGSSDPAVLAKLRFSRNAHLVGAAVVFASLAPAFGTWLIVPGLPARAALWFAPVVVMRLQRFIGRPPASRTPQTSP